MVYITTSTCCLLKVFYAMLFGLVSILIFLVLPFITLLLLMPSYISWLKRLALGQFIREEGPQSHHKKAGTPTAGGGLFILLWVLSLVPIVWGLPTQSPGFPPVSVIPVLALSAGVTLLLWGLGLWDDGLKILKKQNKGLGGYTKLAIQAIAGLGLGYVSVYQLNQASVDFFGMTTIPMGWLYLPYAAFAVTATSNAVNLTDGLDGLASGGLVTSFLVLAGLIGVTLAQGGYSPYEEPAMIAILFGCLAAVSVLLGFLCFNHHPAKIFMGDSGSLALGGLLACFCLLSHQDAWFLGFGILYVVEALSVVLQVLYFKVTHGKRLFKMAPLHHHFELLGWTETTVVRVFVWLNGLIGLGCLLLKVYSHGANWFFDRFVT